MTASEATIRIYLCGRLAITRGDLTLQERDFPARQGRRMWAFLVLNRQQPIGREDVAGAVWGDAIPDAWESSLSALATRLRRALAPVIASDGPLLIGEGSRFELRLPASVVVDFERARASLHRADVLMRKSQWSEALAEARVATEIAARGFLPGEAGAWIEGQRRLLWSVRLHALTYTVEAELERGNIALAEREAEQLIALDPLRETSHHLLMRAMATAGNTSGVHRALTDCRRVLAAEGMTPSIETEELAVTLLKQ